MKRWIGAIVAAFAVSFGSATAQQGDAPFPYEQLPLNVVGIAPPTGWRTAYFSVQGAAAELGELTPQADVTQWRDLMAYLTVATSTGQRVDDMTANLADVASHCAASATFALQPSATTVGESWGEIVCLDRPGQANTLPGAPLQIYVFRTIAKPDATFRFWRAWRGAASDVTSMLSAEGIGGFGGLRATATPSDLRAAFAPVMQALTDRWAVQLAPALEVCDLAGQPCASLNRSVEDVSAYEILAAREPNLGGVAHIQGDRSDVTGAREIYRRTFGSEPPSDDLNFVLSLRPSNHRFNSPQSMGRVAAMMYAGAHSNSGMFSVGADAPTAALADLARMRAYLLKVARIAASARNGPQYDSFRFDLWPRE
jgi:hypothetical protein